MTDFIQLAPDRTAELTVSGQSIQITVTGFSGRNVLANISRFPSLSSITKTGNSVADAEIVGRIKTPTEPAPNTTMRVALQRRIPGVPGDLGWQTSTEIILSPSLSDFHVTWSGSLAVPADVQAQSHRILVTESETYLRTDIVAGDPNLSTSPLDFVRERVVYADVFEL